MKKLSYDKMKKKFNLGYLDLLKGNPCPGYWQLPYFLCTAKTYPDYIALYSQPGDYTHTQNTAVSFAQYDDVIDGLEGLFNAIKYNLQKKLDEYKLRFKDVPYIIIPDYSQFADGPRWVNAENLGKGRIVGLWFQRVMRKIVIPLITFPSKEWFDEVLIGLKDCSVVAFNTKCYVQNPKEWPILQEAVKQTVDTLSNLKVIVVYDVCKDNNAVNQLFFYATQKGIKIVVPDNALKTRNRINAEKRRLKHESFLR